MRFRMMDEANDFGNHGVLLICTEYPDGAPQTGMELRDAYGKSHRIDSVEFQYEMYFLHISGENAEYFGRLFRDVRVDATLFTEEEECR